MMVTAEGVKDAPNLQLDSALSGWYFSASCRYAFLTCNHHTIINLSNPGNFESSARRWSKSV
jgi:hypothetical protein